MTRPLSFGVMTIQNVSWPTLVERWKYLDELGFDSAWVADHFTNPWYPGEPWLEAWTLLSALAAHTQRIRLGTMVTNISLHNPAVLAKQAVTVDHVSDGRLELGIGAGGAPTDHAMTGVPNWDPPERAARLREFVEIVDRLLRDEATTYQGHYYQVENSQMHPASLQKPRPPLSIAALGPKTLRIAAQYADSWNFFPEYDVTVQQALEQTARRNQMLDEYCAELGRDPAEITRSLLASPRMVESPFDSDDAFHDFIGRDSEAGIDEFIFYWWREDTLEYGYDRSIVERSADREILERLATEVIPTLRSATERSGS
jgi:alkanesulfonate monooxygenase SsuD/methylene tetrahydromethanopterin reductase-like flavin-dependent oxidoreductase (luciferase family)